METTVVRTNGLEPGHKQQHSYDSGAYIEWPGEEGLRDEVEPKFASNVTGEFVTVVAVEPADPQPSPYVTVLAIGDEPTNAPPLVEDDAEDVLVYRLPGERLGFALKFEGGLKTTENVGKLYIQSCAPDSPASRTKASWGPLGAGDEVLEIDGQKVCEMTRIDCVRLLKESNVVIKLRIRPLHKDVVAVEGPATDSSPPPPPIPPRKTPRRNSTAKEKPAIVCPPDGFADLDSSNVKINGIKPDDNLPEAEVYMDLLAKEAEIPVGESESDDTGSSISTVVDRLSSNSSFSDVRSITSLDITAPPTPTVTTATTFDLDRVLEPFLQLEREFSSSATSVENSLFTKLVALTESQSHATVSRKSSASVNDDEALQPPENFKDSPENVAVDENKEEEDCGIVMKPNPRTVHNVNVDVEAPELPPKPTPRKDLKSKFKSGKKRPPPPPPPRSDRPLCPDPESPPVNDQASYDGECDSDHLPRLIDFVPKDRTDVVVPNAIHPDPNQLDLLIQQRRLLDLISSKPESADVPHSEAEADSSWYPCDVLDTIGEMDEEQQLPSFITETVADDVEEDVTAGQENVRSEVSIIGEKEEEERKEEEVNYRNGADEKEDGELIVEGDDCSETPEIIEKDQTHVACVDEPELKTEDASVEGDNLQEAADVDQKPSTVENDKGEGEAEENEEGGELKENEVREEPEEDKESVAAPVTSAVELNREQDNGLPLLPADNVADIPARILAADDVQATNKTGARRAMDTLVSDITALNLSPPPSFSRLPPDGHEFPPDYQEYQDQPNYQEPHYQDPKYQEQQLTAKALSSPPPLPCSAPPIMRKPVMRSSSAQQPDLSEGAEDGPGKCGTRPPPSWRNDEKSEKSVRDKIAMFSNVNDEAPIYPAASAQPVRANRKLNRFKSSEDVFLSNGGSACADSPSHILPGGKLLSRSVMSVDKVVSSSAASSSPYLPESDDVRTMKKGTLTYSSSVDVSPLERRIKTNGVLEFANRTCSSTDLTSSASSTSSAYSSCSPESSLSPTISPYVGYSSTLPRKNQTERKTSLASTRSPSLDGGNKSHTTGLSRAVSFTVGSKLHTRSQSLVDVGSGLNKYVPKSINNSNNTEEARRASLNALIEQRRRSISKLRGLVIPEKVNEVPSIRQTILDLPEIISKDAVLPAKKSTEETRLQSINSYRIGSSCIKPTATQTASTNLLTPPWKSETDTGVDLPKYSPAFKRKSLAVYGISSSASSVSSSLSSSREELRPYFDNNSTNNFSKISKMNKVAARNGYMSSDTDALQNNEPPKSLESITSPTRSDISFEFVSSSPSSPDDKMMTNGSSQSSLRNNHEPEVTPVIKMTNGGGKRQQLSVDGRRSTGEESDNDSAVSSSRSSISHDFSPPPSPLPDHLRDGRQHDGTLSPSNSASSGDQRTLRRTLSSETTASAASSTASTLTSGSQASCSSSNSDSMNRRVLKAQSVEAINRKNVLSSARFSSGQDLKVGSPLIQRKFENENILDVDVENDNNQTNDQQHTKNFIEKLNETLLKEDSIETGSNDQNEEDGEELICYQIAQSTNVNFELNPTKVAYMEVEVVDGNNMAATESEQMLSDSSSSNPSSMDGLSYGYSSDSKIMYNGSENECDNNNGFYSGSYKESDKNSERRVVKKDVAKNDKSSAISNEKSGQKEVEDRVNGQKEAANGGGKVMASSSARVAGTRRSVSVNDIRKAFEKADLSVNKQSMKSAAVNGYSHSHSHARVSSLDSTASEDSSCVQTPTHFGSITNLQKEQQFGSITSLASSTSLISQQELQQLIDDANQTLEESGRGGGGSGGVSMGHEVLVVILHRDLPASSVGITLAGGADYESKQITVHKVLAGSPADRDGRIQKGDRILSINGKSMKGVTHRESLTILKAPRPEVVLVVSRWRPEGGQEGVSPPEDPLVVSIRNNQRHPRIPEQPLDLTTALLIEKECVSRGPPVTVCLQKDGAGLGFSLEGGKDSPLGDMPLTIKKIFTGGCAEKSGQLFAGDELLVVNGTDVTGMSRIEAWSLMKRLADGRVTLSLRHKTV
ncbi:uncharacterized protein LOC111062867 isoform X2 [Nilaparvata lugens]|uniref:uncharacterized protein LOC111062867 isoform X2 n=1 Tax=Nilaparvata lugens TaxID=108931 RepID=UPI00193EAFAA|nr:uncharacterized protein LOC111062867 isoform X2 [Nilaparvata lugens]